MKEFEYKKLYGKKESILSVHEIETNSAKSVCFMYWQTFGPEFTSFQIQYLFMKLTNTKKKFPIILNLN